MVHSLVEKGRKQVRIDLYFIYVGQTLFEDWKRALKRIEPA